jgi:hypothetical protein
MPPESPFSPMAPLIIKAFQSIKQGEAKESRNDQENKASNEVPENLSGKGGSDA